MAVTSERFGEGDSSHGPTRSAAGLSVLPESERSSSPCVCLLYFFYLPPHFTVSELASSLPRGAPWSSPPLNKTLCFSRLETSRFLSRMECAVHVGGRSARHGERSREERAIVWFYLYLLGTLSPPTSSLLLPFLFLDSNALFTRHLCTFFKSSLFYNIPVEQTTKSRDKLIQ